MHLGRLLKVVVASTLGFISQSVFAHSGTHSESVSHWFLHFFGSEFHLISGGALWLFLLMVAAGYRRVRQFRAKRSATGCWRLENKSTCSSR